MIRLLLALLVAAAWWPAGASGPARRASALVQATSSPRSVARDVPRGTPTLEAAQQLFYNGDYEGAAALALALRTASPGTLAAYELRTSALHFQIRKAMGEAKDKGKAFKACAGCQELMTAFLADIKEGQALARARLKTDPADQEALFFLGKINLNYVWLQLGTLGRRTGWGEYREARRSIDAVLDRDPDHVRARIARAWNDYIVATRIPRGFKWILGGGNRKRALAAAHEAANTAADFFTSAEARFALWEMQVREKNFAEAVVTAQGLARDFPANRDLMKFLETHSGAIGALTRPSRAIRPQDIGGADHADKESGLRPVHDRNQRPVAKRRKREFERFIGMHDGKRLD